MADTPEQFEARVRDTHKRLRRYENDLNELEAYFDERPLEAAQALLLSLPEWLEAWRNYALARFGVDLEAHEQRGEPRWTNLADVCEYSLLLMKYDTFDSALLRMISVRATGERGERAARLVCAAFISAWRDIPGMMAVAIEAFQKAVPRLANTTGLAEYLTGHLATHTSMQTNLRLRAGVAERREEGETLFARLLKELPAEALTAYREKPPAWGDLMDLRSKVARRLEKRDVSPAAGLRDLVQFADREALLRRGREAGLPPREYELFGLVMREPERFLRYGKLNHAEAAREMNLAEGTIKSLWSRIRKTLVA
jgi:hypothetical protein